MTDNDLAILGLGGTALFGLLSIWFYLRSRQFRRLDAVWSVARLQSRNHPEIQILFQGKEVSDLSRLRVVLFNSGTQPIQPKQDFPGRYGGSVIIETSMPNEQHGKDSPAFLSAAVVAGDSRQCSASAEVVRSSCAVTAFEYLNPGQWIGLEVLFSGETPKIKANLIGGSVRVRPHSGVDWVDVAVRELFPVAFVLAAALSASVAVEQLAPGGWLTYLVRWVIMLFAGIGAFLVLRPLVVVWHRWRGRSRDGGQHRFGGSSKRPTPNRSLGSA